MFYQTQKRKLFIPNMKVKNRHKGSFFVHFSSINDHTGSFEIFIFRVSIDLRIVIVLFYILFFMAIFFCYVKFIYYIKEN